MSPCNPKETTHQIMQILRAVKQVNPCKATGPDRVALGVLKASAEHLAGVYTHIFNTSLKHETVPQQLRDPKNQTQLH